MKELLAHRKMHYGLLAMLLPGLVLVACDNQMNISPTVPTFTDITTNFGAIRTLRISGSLVAEQGSCLRATILFNGVEIQGARTRCEDAQGCAELELAGEIGAPAGHHTITFEVLRQSAESQEYRVTGRVEVSGADLRFLEPAILNLRPKRAALQAGEGVSYEIDLLD